MSNTSSHESKNLADSLASSFENLKVDDGSLQVAFALRDKTAPYSPPTVFTISTIAEIDSFLDASPNQVHYILLAKEENKEVVKVSYSPRARELKYNLQVNGKNFHNVSLSGDFVKIVASLLAESMQESFIEFCNT